MGQPFPFDGSALVFGGSEGMGLAVARRLRARGMPVGLVARRSAPLQAAQQRLLADIPSLSTLAVAPADVTRPAEVQAAVQLLLQAVGPPSLVVNCAGYTQPGYVDALAPEQYAAQLHVHAMGMLHVVQACLPAFRAQGRGHFVATASVLGLTGMFGYSAYAASKFAMVGLCLSLRAELRRENIRVSLLCPPAVDTPGFAQENRIKPAQVLAVERRGGVMSADDVARRLERALPGNPLWVLPSWSARCVGLGQRIAPEWMNRMLSRPRD
ncbi:SDR family NAD(P)-dependent oxidoreductase [Rubrivivax rivuli]|nr:SDR family NAD(P)-dependent oxidoreductase [Rubrivivax rivuli]